MKYKVSNLERDMKFMKDGAPVVIKRGESLSVSVQEYQYLATVYGNAVRGEKEFVVRITKPVTIETIETEKTQPVVLKKKRKNKRS